MNHQLASAVVDFVSLPTCESAQFLRRYRDRQWRSSMHWLVTSGLALYLLDELKLVSTLEVLPPATRATLEQMWSASAARVQALEASLLDLNQRFSAAGLRFANWKGFATVPDFCPDARLRAFSDFDFLIEEQDVLAFDRVLTGCGYTKTNETHDEVRYENQPGANVSFLRSYDDTPRRMVELHTRFNSAPGAYQFPTDDGYLDRHITRWRGDVTFPVLAPADAFLLHALHVTRHFLDGWTRPAWLLELRTFVQTHGSDAALWQEVRLRAESMPGCVELLGIALWLSSCLFASDAQDCLGWAVQSLPPRILAWLQRFGRAAALAEFPGTKLPLMLNRELLDRRSWAALEGVRFIPFKKPPRISRPQDSSLRQRAVAAGWQARFVWMRLRFHAVEGARYAIEKRRWDRSLVASSSAQPLPMR